MNKWTIVAAISMTVLPSLSSPEVSFAQTRPPNARTESKVLALPAMREWTGDFDGMLERRTVRILVPFSKTAFFIDKGTALGIEAELGAQFEKWLNRRYAKKPYKIYVAFIPTPFDQLMSALVAGKGDIAAGTLTVTPERKAVVDFATPWASDVKELLVTGPAAPEIKSRDELGGKQISVRRAASYYNHIVALNEENKKAGKPVIDLKTADPNLTDEDLLEMVSAGLLPWTVVDRFKAIAWSGILKGLTIREDIVFNEGGDIAWAVRKDSPKLQKELEEFVSQHKIGTAFGNDLRNRYVTSAKPIKNALSRSGTDDLKKLLPYFQQYGGQFQIDPLLIAAQGYQESGFDQKMRSKAGAVGVMQIKPTTAREKQIAINDVVSSAENNIHAGSKYLRFMVDKYIPDPDVEPRDKVFMALAAYNAGPGNLRKFREYAKQHGFDPTKWFGNVENGAAAIIGQETVQYIGNIYKYYIAYSVVEASQPPAAPPSAAKADAK